MMTSDDPLAAMQLIREHIKELQQRNEELKRRNTQLEGIARLAQLMADDEVARMKKLIDDYEVKTKPKNKGGRPSHGLDDEFVLDLVNKSLAYLKANGMVNRIYRDSDAARFIAKVESRAKDTNWVETEKTEAWKTAHKKHTKNWIKKISEMRTRQKTHCE